MRPRVHPTKNNTFPVNIRHAAQPASQIQFTHSAGSIEHTTICGLTCRSARSAVLANYHNSASDRGEKATFREASRYAGLKCMKRSVSTCHKCDVCQLAKGGRPTRQGLLREPTLPCVHADVHGPGRPSTSAIAIKATSTCRMIDPFVWIELISTKDADFGLRCIREAHPLA